MNPFYVCEDPEYANDIADIMDNGAGWFDLDGYNVEDLGVVDNEEV